MYDIKQLIKSYNILNLKVIELTNQLYELDNSIVKVIESLLDHYKFKWEYFEFDDKKYIKINLNDFELNDNKCVNINLNDNDSNNLIIGAPFKCRVEIIQMPDWLIEIHNPNIYANELNFNCYIDILEFESLLMKLAKN